MSASTEVPADGGSPIRDEAPAKPAASGVVNVPGLLTIVGTITSQTVLITGLLYYFGWARAQASLAYFGLDTSLIAYGTADYVLRSVDVAFRPFIGVAFTGLVLVGFHRLVVLSALETPAQSRTQYVAWWLITGSEIVAAALAAIVIIGLLIPTEVRLGVVLPLLLIVSVALFGYIAYLRAAHPEASATRPWRLGRPSFDSSNNHALSSCVAVPRSNSYPLVQALALLALGLLGALWAVGLYADRVGTRLSRDLVAGLPNRAAVVIYSTERIAIAGNGVEVSEIDQPGSRYRYQYSGIRLLVRSDDKYLLLPVSWRRGRDRVFLVQDDETIRIDVAVQ